MPEPTGYSSSEDNSSETVSDLAASPQQLTQQLTWQLTQQLHLSQTLLHLQQPVSARDQVRRQGVVAASLMTSSFQRLEFFINGGISTKAAEAKPKGKGKGDGSQAAKGP